MAIRFVRVFFTALVVSALGFAVFAQVGTKDRMHATIVVKNPGKTSRLDPKLLKGATPRAARTLTAAQVKKISTDLKVRPSATEWQDVTLDARHTYYPRAMLYLQNADMLNVSENYVFMVARGWWGALAQVRLNAPSAGDTFLVTYYVSTTQFRTHLSVLGSGQTPSASMTLEEGEHQIPIALVTDAAGPQYLSLVLTNPEDEGQSMFLQKVEVQLLNP